MNRKAADTTAKATASDTAAVVARPARMIPAQEARSPPTVTASITGASVRRAERERRRPPRAATATSARPAAAQGQGEGPDDTTRSPRAPWPARRRPAVSTTLRLLAAAEHDRSRPARAGAGCRGQAENVAGAHELPFHARRTATASSPATTRALPAVGEARLASTPAGEKRRNGSPKSFPQDDDDARGRDAELEQEVTVERTSGDTRRCGPQAGDASLEVGRERPCPDMRGHGRRSNQAHRPYQHQGTPQAENEYSSRSLDPVPHWLPPSAVAWR